MNHLRPITEGTFKEFSCWFVAGIEDGRVEWCGSAICLDGKLIVQGTYARRPIGGGCEILFRPSDTRKSPTHYDPVNLPPL